MASLIETLFDVLEQEIECYRKELDIASKKTDIIVNNDLSSLQQLNKEEQQLTGKIFRIEKEREKAIKDIALVLNQNERTLTIENLITLLKSSQKEQKKMQMLREEILDIVEKVKEKNDQNQKLIAHSLEYIDFTINALQSSRSRHETNVYEQKGQSVNQHQEVHYFDAKQ